MVDDDRRNEENLKSFQSKLQSLFNISTIDENLLIIDSIIEAIVQSSKNSKMKRKFVEIVSVPLETFLKSDVFRVGTF